MNRKVRTETASDDEADAPNQIMRGKMGRRAFLKGALATAPLLIAAPTILTLRKSYATTNSNKGLGSSTTAGPYMIPSVSGVKFISILTVGDVIDSYLMVGIPDGLGLFTSGFDRFTVIMNHELGGTVGTVRKHGSPGAFVSRWVIDRSSLKVRKGQDFTQSPNDVLTWNAATKQYVDGTTVW
ncbi:MAG: hypothetical protein ACREQO_20485, partial [Candidatus Binatia bacterium]